MWWIMCRPPLYNSKLDISNTLLMHRLGVNGNERWYAQFPGEDPDPSYTYAMDQMREERDDWEVQYVDLGARFSTDTNARKEFLDLHNKIALAIRDFNKQVPRSTSSQSRSAASAPSANGTAPPQHAEIINLRKILHHLHRLTLHQILTFQSPLLLSKALIIHLRSALQRI
jgi:hypothetical protein